MLATAGLSVSLLAAACAATRSVDAPPAGVLPAARLLQPSGADGARATNPFRDAARSVLVPSCGRCHRSSLATAKAQALAVFDLDAIAWHAGMTEGQLEGLERRVMGSDEIGETEREAFAAFLRCERDGACGPNG